MLTKQLTKADVTFNDFHVLKVIERDKEMKEVTKWLVNVGYKVSTAEGEEYNRDKQIELTGTNKTTVSTFFNTLKAKIIAEEGIQ